MPNNISLKEFEILCRMGHRYEGSVEGLGYVYWKLKNVQLPLSGMPSQTIYNTPRGSQFSTDLYELVVVKDEKNSDTGIDALRSIREIGIDVLSLYGIAKSIETMSKKPVIVGPKYIQVNPQGTVRHNPNIRYTTKGAIAGSVGNKILVAGIIVDWSMVALGERTWQEATVNTAVNTGIWAVGVYCPPAGVILGIAWFIISGSSRPKRLTYATYEEIHGSITPRDNTRVAIPIYDIETKRSWPVYERKQYYFKQGRR
jgi:hypothetical protein